MEIVARYHGIFAHMAACREERLGLPDDASILDGLELVGRQHPRVSCPWVVKKDSVGWFKPQIGPAGFGRWKQRQD